jgi:hypothetical protein
MKWGLGKVEVVYFRVYVMNQTRGDVCIIDATMNTLIGSQRVSVRRYRVRRLPIIGTNRAANAKSYSSLNNNETNNEKKDTYYVLICCPGIRGKSASCLSRVVRSSGSFDYP